MAASHRTPLMRDQWRADDDIDNDYRHNRHRRERYSTDRRKPSPARLARQEGADVEVKIKGRAIAERVARPAVRPEKLVGSRGSDREVDRNLSRSRKSKYNSNLPTRDEGKSSEKPLSNPHPYHRNFKSSVKRKRSRSRSSERELLVRRDERGRSHTPLHPSRYSRPNSPLHRHRGRNISSPLSPRADYHSYHNISTSYGYPTRDSHAGSYIPLAHRRYSPVPERSRNLSPTPRHSLSIGKNLKTRSKSPPGGKQVFPQGRPSRYRDSASTAYQRDRGSRDTLLQQDERAPRRRRLSLSPSPAESRAYRNKKASPSIADLERAGARPSKMQSSTQPIQSILDDPIRPPSPPRPIPSFDSDSHDSGGVREAFPLHGMKASDAHAAPRPGRPHVDTRQPYSTSPQWTPTSSHHASPQSGSPFNHGRGGWGGQQHFHGQPSQNMNAYSPPFRQNAFPPQGSPQGQYFPNNPPAQYNGPSQQMQPTFQAQAFRGGHTGYRGSHFAQGQDRRFSGSGPTNYGLNPPRGRGGHFQNLQWTASGGSRGRGQTDPGHVSHHQSGQSQSPPQLQPQQSFNQPASLPDDDDNPFRPSKDLQVEDQSGKENEIQSGASPAGMKMLPPSRQSTGNSQAKESSKFSFAFKAKPAPPPAAKQVPSLAQKLKEPPKKENLLETKSKPAPPSAAREPFSSRSRTEHRAEIRTDRREDRRDRDYREEYRDERRLREDRHGDRDYRDQRRSDYRDERRIERSEREQKRDRERERERSPEPRMEKKTLRRLKPRPTLAPEFAESTSVYYRKPGNESVVGSGTYGKVFKAIHVYTKQLAALKKIRMEGEKDGFPVTAVREIKLLQSLKHDNVVCLQEVMVENNDCFMVFEYLSHDLTGLLNHPTFKLEHSHKKHLGKQLFEGLNYLHRRGVLHRDIKAANILVSNIGQLKLADFGLARFFSKHGQPDYTNRVITIWYRSPELLLGETQYGPAVDIWSAACVMIEIFTRHAIFPGDGGEINQLDKIYNVLGTPTVAEWPRLADMAWFELLRPTERRLNTFAEKYQERLTPAAFELLQAMFLYDPSKRPTAGDVLEYPYFTTEDPSPKQAVELKDLEGDWHEFESKALRKENERKSQEARRAVRQEEKEKEKRRASGPGGAAPEREAKRLRPSSSHGTESK